MFLQEKALLKAININKTFGQTCLKCKNETERKLIKNHCPHCGAIFACQKVSFEIYPGEILGLVGESGSGKSTLMDILYFDTEADLGKLFLHSWEEGKENILTISSQHKRFIRNRFLGKVYQNPLRGLKMDFSAISNVVEKLISAGQRNVSAMTLTGDDFLDQVKIPSFRRKDSPKHYSGGMQQRVQIAKALSNLPALILLDEVTTGLDLSVQANVLDLIKQIQRDYKVSMLIVSHDLRVVRMLAERTIVMLDGLIVEQGLTDQILEDPQHAYTQQLVHSLL
jgi:putative phosphonate transport system ATP-binding protein